MSLWKGPAANLDDSAARHESGSTRPSQSCGHRWWLPKVALTAGMVAIVVWGVLGYLSMREVAQRSGVYESGKQLMAIAEHVLEMSPTVDRNADQRLAREVELNLREFLQPGRKDADDHLLTDALLLRSAAVASQGRRLEACALFQEVKLPTCREFSLLPAALLFFEIGEWGIAEQLVEAAVSKPGSDPTPTLRIAAYIRYDLGHQEDVLKHCQEWLKLRPSSAEPWRLLAFVFEDRGQWESALKARQKQMTLTDHPKADDLQSVVELLIRVGEIKRGREEYERFEQLLPQESAHRTVTLARLLFSEGHVDEALQKLQTVSSTESEWPAAQFLIGRVQFSQQQFSAATVALQEVIMREPNNAEAHYLLGQTLARRGEKVESQRYLNFHRQLLDAKVRINSLERLAGRDPRNVAVRHELSKMYHDLGLDAVAKSWDAAASAAKAPTDNSPRATHGARSGGANRRK